MTSAVIELQRECLEANKDLTSILRKAYLIARKLKLGEFSTWTGYELNGYTEAEQIPDYRVIKGELKYKNPYHGWYPIVVADDEKLHASISNRKVAHSVEELLQFTEKNDDLLMSIPPQLSVCITEQLGISYETKLHIPVAEFVKILSIVRNKILEWSILLEEQGILGDDLLFSGEEVQIANSSPVVTQYINNFLSTVSEVEINQETSSFDDSPGDIMVGE